MDERQQFLFWKESVQTNVFKFKSCTYFALLRSVLMTMSWPNNVNCLKVLTCLTISQSVGVFFNKDHSVFMLHMKFGSCSTYSAISLMQLKPSHSELFGLIGQISGK